LPFFIGQGSNVPPVVGLTYLALCIFSLPSLAQIQILNARDEVSPTPAQQAIVTAQYTYYKPDARTNKPIAQLAISVLALTCRVPGFKLFDVKCAWFNEEEYCEFFPRTLFTKQIGVITLASSRQAWRKSHRFCRPS
jgi:hypothetical protein